MVPNFAKKCSLNKGIFIFLAYLFGLLSLNSEEVIHEYKIDRREKELFYRYNEHGQHQFILSACTHKDVERLEWYLQNTHIEFSQDYSKELQDHINNISMDDQHKGEMMSIVNEIVQ